MLSVFRHFRGGFFFLGLFMSLLLLDACMLSLRGGVRVFFVLIHTYPIQMLHVSKCVVLESISGHSLGLLVVLMETHF